MNAAFGVALLLGLGGVGYFLLVDPSDAPRTRLLRRGTASLVALGIGGLSASFAGLDTWLVIVLAIVAAVVMASYSDRASV